MTAAATQIEVWFDATSHSDSPVWCVSLCAEDGDEIRLISTHDDEADAIEAARNAGATHGLLILSRAEDGSTDDID